MTGQRKAGTAFPTETVAGLAELLTAIDGFLHTAHASVSLGAYLRSRGSQLSEEHASALTDWLSFTAQVFRDLAAGHHSQEEQ